MPKTEKTITPESMARELETLCNRHSKSDNESVLAATEIITAIRKPLSVSTAYFGLVVEYMEGLDAFMQERLAAK